MQTNGIFPFITFTSEQAPSTIFGKMILSVATTHHSRAPIAPKPWRNVLYNWQGFIVAAVLSFFLSPFIVHHLGNTEYGTWILLTSVVGYMALLDLGIRGAVTRYIAKYHAIGDHHNSNNVTSSALIILAAAGIGAITTSLAIAVLAVPKFNIPHALIPTAQIVVVLGGMTIAVTLVTGVLEGAIIGLQRFDFASYNDIAFELTRAGSVMAALLLGHGLLALALIQFSIAVGRGISAFAFSSKVYPELNVMNLRWEKRSMKLIASFSIYAVLLMGATRINTFTDPVVISAFLPVQLAAFYGIASSLTTYGRNIVTGVTFTLIPRVSALDSHGSGAGEIQVVVFQGARFASLAILPIVITFVFRGGTFIGLWMGQQYANQSGHVLWILAIALWLDAGLLTIHATTLGLGKHKGLVPFYLIEAAANLGLSIWLVQRVGIIGVAWGTTIPRLVNALLCGPWYLRRSMKLSVFHFSINTWLVPAISMFFFATATLVVERQWQAHSLIMFFAQVGVILPLAMFGGWVFGLTVSERNACRAVVRRTLMRSIEV